jgi:SAM-dependent methyltransferase
MKAKLNRQQQFFQWLKKPLGQVLLKSEQEALNAIWGYVVGNFLCMVGDETQTSLIQESQFSHRLVFSEEWMTTTSATTAHFSKITGRLDTLPLLPNCVDAILLPHLLEFRDKPHHLLWEANEALRPGGYLIITGFNPLSIWGLRSAFSFRLGMPWSGTFRTTFHVKEWLHLLNDEVIEERSALYHPPWMYPANKPCVLIEKCFKTFFSIFGGVYILVAQKKTFASTPVQAKWKKVSARLTHEAVQPVRREICDEKNR